MLIANLGICISEFVGVGAALGLAGVPAQVSVPIAAVGDLADHRCAAPTARPSGCSCWLTIPFFAYPIAAILAHPRLGARGARRSSSRTSRSNTAYLFLFVATAGTTITPFMQLYLQSAVVERGVRAAS